MKVKAYKNQLVLLLFYSLSSLLGSAQGVLIPIETSNNALILLADEKGDLTTLYFGEKLRNEEEYVLSASGYQLARGYIGQIASAYTPAGSRNLLEPAIAVTHNDGNTSLDLRYEGYHKEQITDNIALFSISLKDPVYSFKVVLHYKVYSEEDVIQQWTTISHTEKGEVILHKFASANLYLRGEDFWLTQFHGAWAKEMQPEESKLTHGIKTLDAKLGTRANMFQPPVFMIGIGAPATEDTGDVLFGALEWSGNFRIDLEVDPQNHLRAIAGINNFASEYYLKPGEPLETAIFTHLLAHHGKGEASRKLHSWARKYKILNGEGDRLTLLNNWESTYFDFNEAKLFDLLKDTKKLGVDLFLLDDGWFGNRYPRNSGETGLGDWEANRSKLPNGIGSLVHEAANNDVRFGIWIEPEMINPKSELYEKHPEWAIKQPHREASYFTRGQLALDLSNKEVQDYLFGVVDDLFAKNPDLAYIKWDCNGVIYNAYSYHLKKQSHLYIEYVRGLYKVLGRIRQKYPDVPTMLCSGGGGRVDYGALQYFTEFWPSDNTDPLERIYMQWEYSYFYPALTTSNHVTSWGDQSLKFKVDVAMMGKLGFDIVVHELPETDLQFCQQAIKTYDSIKSIIWHGDIYRLEDPKTNDFASLMYVDEKAGSAVMFNYLVNDRYDRGTKRPIKLKGLDPAKHYQITEINTYPGTSSPFGDITSYSGDFLLKIGFNPQLSTDRKSVVLFIKASPNF